MGEMGQMFMYVKYAEDWRLKQFQILQAQQELQLQKAGQCLYLLAKNTHSLAWRKKTYLEELRTYIKSVEVA